MKREDAQKLLGDQDEQEDFAVWPENWQTLQVFLAMQTQWNVIAGMAGARYQGLRYEVVPAILPLMQVPNEEGPDVFEGLRTMERAALKILNERK